MTRFIPDDIDFSAYERETEFKAKVRKAVDFADELAAEFLPREHVAAAAMRSTKLRGVIEFRPAEVTCWAGYNGHRKSMFTGQVALDLIEQRQRVLVVSLEMLPRKTLYRMCRQACASDMPTAQRREEFLRWTGKHLWFFDHVGRLTPSRCLALLRYFADELQGQHVFIDSMMKVCESEESLDEQKALVGDLCALAQETGLHVHLIAHAKKPGQGGEDKPPSKYDIRGSSAISDQAHNIVMVWMNKRKREEADKREPDATVMAQPDHLVVVEKQRNGSTEGKFSLAFDARSLRFCDSDMAPVDAYPMEFA